MYGSVVNHERPPIPGLPNCTADFSGDSARAYFDTTLSPQDANRTTYFVVESLANQAAPYMLDLGRLNAAGLEHIYTPEAAAADQERIDWFLAGDHKRVLDTMPEFYRYRLEARFGHYLMMIGALGEGDCTAAGRQYGEYENSVGTGQAHVWFDRPEGGFPRPHETVVEAGV